MRRRDLAVTVAFVRLEVKMVNRTLAGLLAAALGIALAVISALADRMDIGKHGFGWKQIAGVIAGVGVDACRSSARRTQARRPGST
jgi:hypothetical protein